MITGPLAEPKNVHVNWIELPACPIGQAGTLAYERIQAARLGLV